MVAISARRSASSCRSSRAATRFHQALIILLLSVLVPAVAAERAMREADFDIPAQPVESALLVFSDQAAMQVMVGETSLAGKNANRVQGRLDVSSALGRLLQNTGLAFRAEGNTVVITAAGNSTASDVRPVDRPELVLAAQQSGSSSGAGRSGGAAVMERQAPRPDSIDEVVVTGTHIRGQAPVASKVIVIGREEIDRTAHATVHEIVQDLPQNFKGGGANESTTVGGGPASVNSSAGSSINLRGLGPGATLVLLNGRRLAPAGIDASFVDVSSLPASAIDRIEILLDGASATYGADAVAGVVNVILRRDYEGAETRAQVGVPTDGGAEEYRVAQTLGANWSTGHVMATYEYLDRASLAARDRRATETQDLRARGGGDFRSQRGVPGTINIGTRTWAIPDGQNGSALTPASFAGREGTRNLFDINETRDVLPEQKRHSLFTTVAQSLGDHVELTMDILASQRDALVLGAGSLNRITIPASNGFYVNPTGGTGALAIDYNFGRDLGPLTTDLDVSTYFGGLGAEIELPGRWSAIVRADHGRETIDQVLHNQPIASILAAALADSNRATAFNPFGDGGDNNPATLDRIRGYTTFASDSRTSAGTLTATGPLLDLPGGALSLATGMEYRDQQFDTTSRATPGVATRTISEAGRNTRAAFAEVRVPFFGEGNAVAALQRLELSMATRYESYSDFGSATSPAFALAWSPLNDVTVRVSRTESFKAPTLPSLNEAGNVTTITTLPDPQSATGTSRVLLWAGTGNRDLQSETSQAWTAGIEWAPSRWPGFQVTVSYFDIEFEDRVQSFATQAASFLQDPRFADLVTRGPTREQRAVACSRGTFIGVNASDCTDLPVAALLSVRPTNTATSSQSGLDLLSTISFDVPVGTLQISLNATYLLAFDEALSRFASIVDVRDRPFQPTSFRALGSAYWINGPWGVGATVRYTDSYRDTLSLQQPDIASWTGLDLQLRYRNNASRGSWLDGVTLALGIENAFDREPPFFNNAAGIAYDPTNSDVIGRTVSLQLRKDWN